MRDPAPELATAVGLLPGEHLGAADQPHLHALAEELHPVLAAGRAILPAGVVRARLGGPALPLESRQLGIGGGDQHLEFALLVHSQLGVAGIAAMAQQLHPAVNGAQPGRGEVKGVRRQRVAMRQRLAEHPPGHRQHIAAVGHLANAPAPAQFTPPELVLHLHDGGIIAELTHITAPVVLAVHGGCTGPVFCLPPPRMYILLPLC